MSIAIIPSDSVPANDTAARHQRGPYARYADIFARIYAETGSVEIALEVYETYRAREQFDRPKRIDLPNRIVEIAAAIFGIAPTRVFKADRHSDVVATRRIVAWALYRRRWSTLRIGAFLNHDHSTILTGLRVVADDQELLLAAHKAEHLLEVDEAEAASMQITPTAHR